MVITHTVWVWAPAGAWVYPPHGTPWRTTVPPHRSNRPLQQDAWRRPYSPAYPRTRRTRRLPSQPATARALESSSRKASPGSRAHAAACPCYRAHMPQDRDRGRPLPLLPLTLQLLLPLGSPLPPPDPRLPLLLVPLPPLAAPPTSSPSAVPPTPAPCSTSPVASSCGAEGVRHHTNGACVSQPRQAMSRAS